MPSKGYPSSTRAPHHNLTSRWSQRFPARSTGTLGQVATQLGGSKYGGSSYMCLLPASLAQVIEIEKENGTIGQRCEGLSRAEGDGTGGGAGAGAERIALAARLAGHGVE